MQFVSANHEYTYVYLQVIHQFPMWPNPSQLRLDIIIIPQDIFLHVLNFSMTHHMYHLYFIQFLDIDKCCWLMGFTLIQVRQEHCHFTKTILLPLMTWREQRPKYQKPSYWHNLSGISRGSHDRDQLTHWSLGDVGVIPRTDSLSMFCEIALGYLNAKGPHWWLVNIGSGNGLVPSVNKALPEPMLTQKYIVTMPQIIFPYRGR